MTARTSCPTNRGSVTRSDLRTHVPSPMAGVIRCVGGCGSQSRGPGLLCAIKALDASFSSSVAVRIVSSAGTKDRDDDERGLFYPAADVASVAPSRVPHS